MNEIGTTVVGASVMLFVTSFVSLAVWAINAKITAAKADTDARQREAELRQQNEMLQLEARIAKDLVAPAVDELRALVRELEMQMNISETVKDGFAGVHKTLEARLPIREHSPRQGQRPQ